jgi:enoyl-CoA hydratase
MSLAALNCAVPVISAIHNYCVGVGVLLAGVSDIVIASKGTRFVLAEVDNGATSGAVQALRLMPEKRARAAMMTALPVQAEELYQYGSIFRLVEEEQLRDTAMHIASVIAGKNAQTIRRMKLSMNGTTKACELQTAYRAEMSYTYELNISGAASEGRDGFFSGVRESYSK